MEWLILFIASWIIFLLLADWKRFKVNMWCGLMAIVLQMSIDTEAMCHGLYAVDKILLFNIWGSAPLFVFGPVFTIATLLAQYHPVKRWLRIVNLFVLAALYSIQEYLLLITGALIYKNWDFIDSIVVNISAMVILSWFSLIVLKKGEDFKR